ncbi:MAG: hypothetical protein JW837_11655 [Sedimentisphaerales bacterium]|nr:hypothetical protein [Sedimentisphaerales bacterium]
MAEICFALLIYSNDYEDKFPRAGGESSVWSNGIANWIADDRFRAYNLSSDGSGGSVSITSSFYLLVKHAKILPKEFTCPGDKGVTGFKPAKYGSGDKELTDLWDFGPNPRRHCSFSYHIPYGEYPLTTSSEPGMAVAADPNPWIGSPFVGGRGADLFAQFNPDERGKNKVGNAVTHEGDGQNVLFMDNHVGFEESPCCGVNDDNIYTYRDGTNIRKGGFPIPTSSAPQDKLDSFLVNDGRVDVGRPTFEEKNR